MKYFNAISDKPNISFVNPLIFEERLDAKYYTNFNLSLIKKLNESKLAIRPLSELCTKITQGPNPKFINTLDGIPCLRTRNVYDEYITLEGANYVSVNEYQKLKRFKIEYGDILVAILGEGSIGKSNIFTLKEKAIFNRPIGLVRVNHLNTDAFYISAYLRSYYGKKFLERGISGSSGQLVLGVEYLKTVPVPIPEIKIQTYIGAKVRKANLLREEAKQLKKEADDLLKKYLKLDNFDKELKVTEEDNKKSNWISQKYIQNRLDSIFYRSKYVVVDRFLNQFPQICTFESVIVSISNGATPKGANYLENGIPFLRVQNIVDEIVDFSHVVYINDETNTSLSRSQLEKGDLLMALSGSIGHTAIYPFETPCNINQHVAKIRINDKKFNNYYISSFLNSNLGKLQQHRAITGAIQGYLSYENIYSLKIPYIEMEKQKEIGNKLKKSQDMIFNSKSLLFEAVKDVESLIEGTFDVSVIQKDQLVF